MNLENYNDPAVMAEVIAQDIEGFEPLCLVCNDTGLVQNESGFDKGRACRCSMGRSNA